MIKPFYEWIQAASARNILRSKILLNIGWAVASYEMTENAVKLSLCSGNFGIWIFNSGVLAP